MLPGKINAMENCARCELGLTTMSGEVNVRFIVLLSLFDRTQGRVCGGKAGSTDLKCHTSIWRRGCCKAVFVVEKRVDFPEMSPRPGGVGVSRQDKRN